MNSKATSVFNQLSNRHIESILKGTFLVVLSVSGNYLEQTLGCHSRILLDNNMMIKHIFVLFIIYFAIDLTQNELINPFYNLLKAFIVWALFHLFTHMNLIMTIIVFILLMVLFFISNYQSYLDTKKLTDEHYSKYNLKKNLKTVQTVLFDLIIVLLCIGSVLYYMRKRKEYKSNFSYMKYIFGVNKCKDTH